MVFETKQYLQIMVKYTNLILKTMENVSYYPKAILTENRDFNSIRCEFLINELL